MRRVRIDRPFVGGIVTDLPSYKLGPQQSFWAQDVIAPEGIARVRRGWDYDGTTADVADNLVAVHRNKYLLADVTRTLTCDDDGDIFIHNAASAGTAVYSGSVQYLPRCVYRDELIWCAQDGVTPLRRYSGASTAGTASDLTSSTIVEGQAVVAGLSFSTEPSVGAYVNHDRRPGVSFRIVGTTSTSLTMEDASASSADASGTTVVSTAMTGTTIPCVSIYSAGSASVSASVATGVGTKWVDDAGVVANQDYFYRQGLTSTDYVMSFISAVTNNTSLTTGFGNLTDQEPHHIMRPCPFKDAQAHKGSLWGTGVAQHPNNVYVSPPNWNPSYSPGVVLPNSPYLITTVENPNDFFLDSIPVPTAYEGDVNVAILSTPNPLLVLKRSAVYGIFGSYPNFSVDKVADGVGCIDVRSAISGPNGQFWAGEDGIYAYVGGRVIDLTEGKINREWRRVASLFDYGTSDYCAIGESNDHLIVSLAYNGGADHICYVYDLRAGVWISEFTNHKARYFFSSKVDGEPGELYWVGDNDQGRVMTSSGCFSRHAGLIGIKDGDGTAPYFRAHTGFSMDGTESIDNDARMLDLAISHNLYDVGAAGSTSMSVTVESGGSLESQANSGKILGTIESDAVDRVDRTRFRDVNKKGRLFKIMLNAPTVGTNDGATTIEVPEISATVRDRRSRT